MAVIIKSICSDSLSAKAGIESGDLLVSINGNTVEDILDYRFYLTEKKVKLELVRDGKTFFKVIKKDEYDDIGLEFNTYLMDKQRRCANNCIFCFIDQLPGGLRESLYFKDDDSRLSFLFGNYITLTNLTEHDISRIIKMHISPVNISVHTTNPELRVKMMKNKNAGKCLDIIPRLAEAGISMNCQIVLCPGINDGEELKRTLSDLAKFYPAVQSVAAVPVGITKHREGLFPLSPYTKEQAANVIDIIETTGNEMFKKTGDRLFYPGDEFYLKSDRPVPDCDFYGEFSQLENGVGMYALTKDDFLSVLNASENEECSSPCAIVTGKLAAKLMNELVIAAKQKYPALDCRVFAIENTLFGPEITVAGLITGKDIISQLKGKKLPGRLLIPDSMLRREGDMFLDDTTPVDIEKALGVKLQTVSGGGDALFDCIFE